MKIEQKIIEAQYSIRELNHAELRTILDGLEAIKNQFYRDQLWNSRFETEYEVRKIKEANELIEKIKTVTVSVF